MSLYHCLGIAALHLECLRHWLGYRSQGRLGFGHFWLGKLGSLKSLPLLNFRIVLHILQLLLAHSLFEIIVCFSVGRPRGARYCCIAKGVHFAATLRLHVVVVSGFEHVRLELFLMLNEGVKFWYAVVGVLHDCLVLPISVWSKFVTTSVFVKLNRFILLVSSAEDWTLQILVHAALMIQLPGGFLKWGVTFNSTGVRIPPVCVLCHKSAISFVVIAAVFYGSFTVKLPGK